MKTEPCKTIGVLTSGGDAPGMNAAVRAVVRSGIVSGMKVKGIYRGYQGLINGDIRDMDVFSVTDITHRGGTILYSARCPEFRSETGILKAVAQCEKHGIDGIVVIGGDGSFRGASDLSRHGINCVGIPGTIDNDISCTDYTIGYDTALNTARDMIDRLLDTTCSHDRCTIVEVMGRGCGDIALNVGMASGATAILVPEVPVDFEKDVIEKIQMAHDMGKTHFIIVVAEGVGGVEKLAANVEERVGITTRATILGHVQRGGTPTVRDRVMATRMGNYAVKLLANGIGDRVVAYKNSEIVDFDIQEALQHRKKFDVDTYHMAQRISL